MKRSTRKELGEQTVRIIEEGSYHTPRGVLVDISKGVRACLDGTRYYAAEDMIQLREEVLQQSAGDAAVTKIEVVNETTLEGVKRLLAEDKSEVAALNFASAKNPGGGFLNGSQAQEESLARSSAMYASQRQAREFYERHRASSSLLYSDSMIWSPDCPVIRNDEGELLSEPMQVSFITSAAPNAGAAADNRPDEVPLIPQVLHQRAELVLALAASQGVKRLVLGAWGCGVFRNDPAMVAKSFAEHLRGPVWSGRFSKVVFSVMDTSAAGETFTAFQRVLGDR